MRKVGGEMGQEGGRVRYIGGGAFGPIFVYGLLGDMR